MPLFVAASHFSTSRSFFLAAPALVQRTGVGVADDMAPGEDRVVPERVHPRVKSLQSHLLGLVPAHLAIGSPPGALAENGISQFPLQVHRLATNDAPNRRITICPLIVDQPIVTAPRAAAGVV